MCLHFHVCKCQLAVVVGVAVAVALKPLLAMNLTAVDNILHFSYQSISQSVSPSFYQFNQLSQFIHEKKKKVKGGVFCSKI